MRRLLLTVHRWAGLTIALALVVTGLTGAVIPYQDGLRSLVASDVWDAAPPSPGAKPLSGLELVRMVEAETGGSVGYFQLVPDPDHAQSIFVRGDPGGPPLGFEQVFVDPYTGDIRAKVRFAELADGPINIVPFLVAVHYSLGAGEVGRLVLGWAALIWTVTSLIGIALSLPRLGGGGVRQFVRRFRPAWSIRRGKGSRVFVFDFHRALGLWLWPLMLVFAWSAVAFNLDAVHEPVQRFFGAEGLYAPVENPSPAAGAPMSREQAVATGERLMAEEAARQGFTVRGPEALSLRPYAGIVGYYARTSLDGPSDNGSTVVWFDQVSGERVAFRPPYGGTGADAFDKALRMLHTADLFGLPYKILVSVFGVLTAAMAAAGALIWLRRIGGPRPRSETGQVRSR